MNKILKVEFSTWTWQAVTAITILSLLLSAFPASFFVAQAQEPESEEEHLVAKKKPDFYICHATNSETNPYTKSPVSTESLAGGHGSNGVNDGDIVPPIDPYYPTGHNWESGQTIWDNDCNPPAPAPIKPLKLTAICVNPDGSALWRVRNPDNISPVDFTWEIYPNVVTGGPITANDGLLGTYFTTPQGGTLKIYWFDEYNQEKSTTKASNNTPCISTTLTLTKSVVGGDAAATSWIVAAEGYMGFSGEGTATRTFTQLEFPGEDRNYTLTESVAPGAGPQFYEAGDWQCTGNSVPLDGSTLTIKQGETVDCTVTNTYVAPRCENLIVNGSFEDEEVTSSAKWQRFGTVTGWAIAKVTDSTPTTLELHRDWSSNEAAYGYQYAELDGDHSTKITQTVPTLAGGLYELTWAFAPRHGVGAEQNQLSVTVDGVSVGTNGPASGSPDLKPTDWQYQSAQFTADDSTEITFADAGPSDSFGTFIDDAQLCLIREPLPPKDEEPEICSYTGVVTYMTPDAKKNNGQPVDANRRLASALDGVASYINYFGKEENDWQVSPLDFVSLGIQGELIYEFTGKVAVDQPGDDIAIWEVTGGPAAQQSDEKAKVYVSQDGVDYTYVGTLTGDGAVDIGPTGYDFVKFVKLVDDSVGVQGASGDGYDVDAITIIDGSCSEYATIVAHKIVCEDEADLPNYGKGGPNMTDTTATNWIGEEHPSCRLASDWEFEWTTNQTNDPGDMLVGQAGSPWNVFGPTDTNGMTATIVTPGMLNGNNKVWMREVLKDGYIPFTHHTATNNSNDVSAEVYCHTDVLNYDNRDFIGNVKMGETYQCVAWNSPEPKPQTCELTVVSDEMTLVVDTNKYAVPTYVHNSWTKNIADATWVWATDKVENPTTEEMYTFVDTFTVATPTAATLTIAADNWFVLYVNGTEVDDRAGQNSFQDFQKQTYDVTPYLVSGENELKVKVVNEPLGNGTYMNNPAGVLYRLELTGVDDCERTTEPEPEKPETRTVVGHKWHDLNRDGVWNDDEPTIPGWTIMATMGETSTTTTTDGDGAYSFTLPYGTWTIMEALDLGWEQTGLEVDGVPSETLTCEFILEALSPEEELAEAIFGAPQCDFGNDYIKDTPAPSYVIDGYKWNDENNDGIWNNEEVGIADWVITITDGEDTYSTTTNSSGYYQFIVTGGSWTVSEEQLPSWNQTATIQNGDPLLSPTCQFLVGDIQYGNEQALVYVSPEYRCEFGNHEVVTPPTPVPDDSDERSSRSGGTRTLRTVLPTPTVLGASTTNSCPFLIDFMQIGISNDSWEVTKLQMFLSIVMGLPTPVTGVFDSTTDANVKLFQERYRSEILDPWYERGIVPHNRPTGFVYKTTRWKINDIVCPGYEPYPSFDGENLTTNINLDGQ
jgi:peptidoglycan hydrolase-like protein with peptidoglycan-binding domain